MIQSIFRLAIAVVLLASCQTPDEKQKDQTILFKNATIITGSDDTPLVNADLLVKNGRIEAIGEKIENEQAEAVDLTGKTIIPGLISSHVHVGTLKGRENSAANFTRGNVLRQLQHYSKYGILMVQSLGTDRKLLFENGLFDSIRNGELEGARMLSAGWGFGAANGAPGFPEHEGEDNISRAETPEEVKAAVDQLTRYPVSILKIWVDNGGDPATPKMKETTYRAIIEEAAKHNLPVASHLYFLADARQLASDGIAVFAHSVRDKELDDTTIQLMKEKKIAYIPTLTLDEFAYVYGEQQPSWINDPFFKSSLEPGVYEYILSEDFKRSQQDPGRMERNRHAFETALKNVKKLRDAGIVVGMGTDSGAQPVRAQGFAEHRELELLVKAGLTPMQAIQAATIHNAQILRIEKDFGSLQKGKIADFVVLDADPLENISNTRQILAVYKAGTKLSL